MARGYQSSATTSDNRVFTIGGAYSGPRKGKDGEVYDPSTNTWTALPNARMKAMLTTDHEGIWRYQSIGAGYRSAIGLEDAIRKYLMLATKNTAAR